MGEMCNNCRQKDVYYNDDQEVRLCVNCGECADIETADAKRRRLQQYPRTPWLRRFPKVEERIIFEEFKCAFCLDDTPTYVLTPCNHKALCDECMPKYIHRFKKCPICRVEIGEYFKDNTKKGGCIRKNKSRQRRRIRASRRMRGRTTKIHTLGAARHTL